MVEVSASSKLLYIEERGSGGDRRVVYKNCVRNDKRYRDDDKVMVPAQEIGVDRLDDSEPCS